jgi:hypothetical protein
MAAVSVKGKHAIHPNFRYMALAHPPIATKWNTPEINEMFNLVMINYLI